MVYYTSYARKESPHVLWGYRLGDTAPRGGPRVSLVRDPHKYNTIKSLNHEGFVNDKVFLRILLLVWHLILGRVPQLNMTFFMRDKSLILGKVPQLKVNFLISGESLSLGKSPQLKVTFLIRGVSLSLGRAPLLKVSITP